MNKKKISEFFKSKSFYTLVMMGVFAVVVVAVISTNKEPAPKQENNLVDLNESPNNLTQVPNQVSDNEENNREEENPDQVADIDSPDLNSSKTDVADSETGKKDVGGVAGLEIPFKEKETDVAKVDTDNKAADTKKDSNKDAETDSKSVADTNKKEETTQSVMTNTVENLKFSLKDGLAWPVEGNIILNYSADRTIYHATLMQFKTNPALLIGCQKGTEVKAAAKGIVTGIENSPITGVTVTVAIGDDYRIVYGQLEASALKVGDSVEKGQKIGNIAKVSRYYSVEGENLYFQVYQGDKTINPLTLLKDIKS